MHVGRVFELCHEKGSELQEGHKGRKHKGRAVFQGNDVKDENWDNAICASLSSSPSSMEASKAADYFGLLPGDAEMAYTQSLLGGTETWVRLPKSRWPAEWVGKYTDPVVRLLLALYGHPDSGGYWERKCDAHLKKIGFERIQDWRSCYFHPTLKVVLVVYVDHFKVSGPKLALQKVWKLVEQGIKIGTPAALGKFLGCDHIRGHASLVKDTMVATDESAPLGAAGQHYTTLTYDMSGFLTQCVDKYQELAGPRGANLRKVDSLI